MGSLRKGFPRFPDGRAEFANSIHCYSTPYYDFHLFSDQKIEEKLSYMHQNPVRAGLVEHPCRPVGVPVGWLD
jgi:hypothetical protein